MDVKLETMRARSRIWDTPFGSKVTSFIQSAQEDFDLDEYDLSDEKFRLENELNDTEPEEESDDNGNLVPVRTTARRCISEFAVYCV